jgi:hypothetical protein
MKDRRNGSLPLACRLIYCDADQRHEIDRFAIEIDKSRRSRPIAFQQSNQYGGSTRDEGIDQVLACFDQDVSDRSRRDFAVVCSLLRLGMRPSDIWSHVENRSKFASRGYSYFETTLSNALEATAHNRGA